MSIIISPSGAMRRARIMTGYYLRAVRGIFVLLLLACFGVTGFGQSIRDGARLRLEGEVVAYYLALLDTPYAVDPYSFLWPADILILRINKDSNTKGKEQYITVVSSYRRTDPSEFRVGRIFEFDLERKAACDGWGKGSTKMKILANIKPKSVPLGKTLPCYLANHAGKIKESEK